MKRISVKLISLVFALVLMTAASGAALQADEGSAAASGIGCRPMAEPVPVVEIQAVKPEPKIKIEISEHDAVLIARTMYGEYRGPDKLQQAAVVWCILNRADHFGQSVEDVVTAPNQFSGYSEYNPIDEELYSVAEDVLYRHAREKMGECDVGRILPREYLWFAGDGQINHYRNSFSSGERWDWSLPDPYTDT